MTSASPTARDRQQLSAQIKTWATEIGFDLVGIAPAVSPTGVTDLEEWLQNGYAGEMAYIENRQAAYEHPKHVLEGVKSVIMLGLNYHTADAPPETGNELGRVARYAWGQGDYHDIIRDKLKQLANPIHEQQPGCRTRAVVDTAPLLERDFARLAGLGWFGKNTLLINKQAGSWLFLAALLVDFELAYDSAHESSHCGTCTRCLDACPTDAFPQPYVLDARKCISYLTIELRSSIPVELRPGMEDWLFGCDICQDVCPWNRKAPASNQPEFQPVEDLSPANARDWLNMDEATFRKRFRRTPLTRPKRAGLLRNAAIVLGNNGDAGSIPTLERALCDDEPLIRGAVAWALGQIGGTKPRHALQSRLPIEDNADVINEINNALSRSSD